MLQREVAFRNTQRKVALVIVCKKYCSFFRSVFSFFFVPFLLLGTCLLCASCICIFLIVPLIVRHYFDQSSIAFSSVVLEHPSKSQVTAHLLLNVSRPSMLATHLAPFTSYLLYRPSSVAALAQRLSSVAKTKNSLPSVPLFTDNHCLTSSSTEPNGYSVTKLSSSFYARSENASVSHSDLGRATDDSNESLNNLPNCVFGIMEIPRTTLPWGKENFQLAITATVRVVRQHLFDQFLKVLLTTATPGVLTVLGNLEIIVPGSPSPIKASLHKAFMIQGPQLFDGAAVSAPLRALHTINPKTHDVDRPVAFMDTLDLTTSVSNETRINARIHVQTMLGDVVIDPFGRLTFLLFFDHQPLAVLKTEHTVRISSVSLIFIESETVLSRHPPCCVRVMCKCRRVIKHLTF